MQDQDEPRPLYQTVKGYIVRHIQSGEWVTGNKIPSEAELVERFGVSRMTANRALNELTLEGHLTRVQGVGTFVAKPVPVKEAALLDIRSIKSEILDRGNDYSCKLISKRLGRAPVRIAKSLNVTVYTDVFHVVLLHFEDLEPVQIEDRYVNPAVAPDFLEQDFTEITPSAYLLNFLPVTEMEHNVQSRLPDSQELDLLELTVGTPMLELNRRTWSGRHVVTNVRLTSAGSYLKLSGRYKADKRYQN